MSISPEKGALTQVHCACQPGIERYSGWYFASQRLAEESKQAKDDAKAKALWKLSEQLVNK